MEWLNLYKFGSVIFVTDAYEAFAVVKCLAVRLVRSMARSIGLMKRSSIHLSNVVAYRKGFTKDLRLMTYVNSPAVGRAVYTLVGEVLPNRPNMFFQ